MSHECPGCGEGNDTAGIYCSKCEATRCNACGTHTFNSFTQCNRCDAAADEARDMPFVPESSDWQAAFPREDK